MTSQEALAQALIKAIDYQDKYADEAAADILDALRNVPGGRWLVINRDEWDVLCERIGAQQERERLRERVDAELVAGDPSDIWTQREVYLWVMDTLLLADPEPDR